MFFQFKTTIYGHEINLNIADPFVLIVFGLTIFNFLKTGNLPKWKYKDINLMTTIGLLLIIGFLIGYYDIGFSKWSFYNRLLGYIIILGYFV